MTIKLTEITKDHYQDWKEIIGTEDFSVEQFEKLLSKFHADHQSRRGFYFLISDNDQIVGMTSIFNIAGGQFRYGMLDYTVKERFRRRGYAYEGLKLLEEYLFKMGLKKIVAYVELNNKPSQELLKKSSYEHRIEEYAYFDNDDNYRPAMFFWKVKPGIKRLIPKE